MRLIELSGHVFGRLTVVSRADSTARKEARWNCLCECGKTTTVDSYKLRTGEIQSCGCWHRDRMIEVFTTHGATRARSMTPEYRTWISMRRRCRKIKDQDYRNYGGRGIAVCQRWLSFDAFFADMGQRPSPLHSLDRINNDGNYEPGNCRWSTMKEQIANRRTTVLIDGSHGSMLDALAEREGTSREKIVGKLIERAFQLSK